MNLSSPGHHAHAGVVAYATVCTSIAAVLLLTNWPSYQYAIRGGPIPLVYYVLPGVFALPILFAQPASIVRLFKNEVFWWFLGYVLLGLAWVLLSQDFIEQASQQWRLRLLSFLIFCAVVMLVSHSNRVVLAWVILGCVFLIAAASWFDVMRPHRFVPPGIQGSHPGRGAATYVNPNAAASFIVMGTIAALPFMPMRVRGVVLVAAVVGVAATLSRGGFVLCAVMILAAMWQRLLSRAQILLVMIALPVLIGAAQIYYYTLIRSSDVANLEQTVDRLRWFEGEEDASSAERRWAASQAQDMFLDEPLVGQGVGVTRRADVGVGPHNMYIELMAEQGLFGLALYLGLIIVIYRRGRRIARLAETPQDQDAGRAMAVYAVFLAAYGMFSHNILEESQGIFVMACITAAAVASAGRELAASPQTRRSRPQWGPSSAAVARAVNDRLRAGKLRRDTRERIS